MTEVCEAIRAKIEQKFRHTIRIERQTKKGTWKVVTPTFTIRASPNPVMVAACAWVVVETKRSARYRAFQNGTLLNIDWWNPDGVKMIDRDESLMIDMPVGLT